MLLPAWTADVFPAFACPPVSTLYVLQDIVIATAHSCNLEFFSRYIFQVAFNKAQQGYPPPKILLGTVFDSLLHQIFHNMTAIDVHQKVEETEEVKYSFP